MKKKLSKAEQARRDIRAIRSEINALSEMIIETHDILIDIAYLLAPVIYDVRTKGKYPLKSMRRVTDLVRKNDRGDMTKLERAFWTGEKEEVD